MPFLTPDAPVADDAVYCLTLPDEPGIRELVKGSLSLLIEPINWKIKGGLSHEEAAELFYSIFRTMRRCYPLRIGDIILSGRSDDEAHYLLCDGRTLDASAYKALFDAIGYTFGGSGGFFNIPDMPGFAPVGAGGSGGRVSVSLGQTTGEKDHTLSDSEMPIHSHNLGFTLAPAQAGAGVMAATPGGVLLSSTSTAGGGSAHNNVQPSIGLNFFIITD